MGVFRLVARVGCLRGGAIRLLEEWSHIASSARRWTEPGLQTLWHFFSSPLAAGRSSTREPQGQHHQARRGRRRTRTLVQPRGSAGASRQTRSKAATMAAAGRRFRPAKRRQADCAALAAMLLLGRDGIARHPGDECLVGRRAPALRTRRRSFRLRSSHASSLSIERGARPRHDRFQRAERQPHDPAASPWLQPSPKQSRAAARSRSPRPASAPFKVDGRVRIVPRAARRHGRFAGLAPPARAMGGEELGPGDPHQPGAVAALAAIMAGAAPRLEERLLGEIVGRRRRRAGRRKRRTAASCARTSAVKAAASPAAARRASSSPGPSRLSRAAAGSALAAALPRQMLADQQARCRRRSGRPKRRPSGGARPRCPAAPRRRAGRGRARSAPSRCGRHCRRPASAPRSTPASSSGTAALSRLIASRIVLCSMPARHSRPSLDDDRARRRWSARGDNENDVEIDRA